MKDFEFELSKTGDWKIGVRPVLTGLGDEQVVYIIVTLPKSGNGNFRLFFCIKDLKNILLDYNRCEDDTIRGYGGKMNSSCSLFFLMLLIPVVPFQSSLTF